MAKIVILNDILQHGEILGTRLTHDGHVVHVVSDGADAIDLAYLFQPDLLVTEWCLESDEYDGFEVAEAFNAAKDNVKTIVFSGRHSNQSECLRLAEIYHGKDIGLIATLPKPASIDQLAQTVRDAMRAAVGYIRSSQLI